jgi:DNA-binding FadR family transcriptional regulator
MNSTNFQTVGSNKRLVDRVVSEIQNQIIEGKLPLGTRLPPALKSYEEGEIDW